VATPDALGRPPLGRLFRVLLRLNRLLVRAGAVPRTDKIGSVPMAKRLAIKPPSWSIPKPTDEVWVEDAVADGRHGRVPLRVYRPSSGHIAATAVLYVHGGGFTTGGLDALDWFCRELSRRGDHTVVSVQYRLSPDHHYPVPLDDVQDALVWLERHLTDLGATEIAVVGDSAGGNLAAAVCARARDAGCPAIRQQILIYPALDATHSSASTADQGASLSSDDIVVSFHNYAGDHPSDDPEISPLLAADQAGLPATLVLTADHDILRDEGRRYAEALAAAGTPAVTIEYPATDHAFLSLPILFKAATATAIADVLAALELPGPTSTQMNTPA
jgi:acetyl esterase